MSKVLVIDAHPLDAAHSHTLTVLDTFMKAYTDLHPDDEIETEKLYDEYLPEIDADMLNGWAALRGGTAFESLSDDQKKKINRFNEFTQQFLDADKVIVANPLWNQNIPTRLKAWFDTTCVAGKSFKYSPDGKPIGLQPDKKALHIQSAGGTYHEQDIGSQYVKRMFSIYGVTAFQQIEIDGIDYAPDKETEIMDAANQQAETVAKTF
ncbi:FMN-dependent NADH-azoreductase [Lactobacillus selangorensis]|uniref:FMN dependent NADH:quinone oxidoreductase n=1 Tax=Lactobacillus selangorensis TaxID=81857 RepID=A0A0R2FPT0_9LACO|nr:NAD(P)H-dependent oxidoreductase [Lactobacillus selangorensis]KRN27982.1 FMN-dependent NADH-azoreductase [Lactobacillus selangorensis]KRN30547.1 FMN-dependent NADH-azoreductase [Lactobacillus selangorensis]